MKQLEMDKLLEFYLQINFQQKFRLYNAKILAYSYNSVVIKKPNGELSNKFLFTLKKVQDKF